MHIIIIANGFQSDYILNLVNNLAKVIKRIDLIGSDIYPVELLDKRIEFYNLRGSHEEEVSKLKKIKRIIIYYIKLYNFITKSKANCIHIQWIRFSLLEGVLLNSLIKLSGKRMIYTAHDVLPHDRDNFLNRMIFYLIYHLYPSIVVHTEYLKGRIVKEFKVSEDKIHVVKHGVYQVNYSYGKIQSRKKLNIGTDEFVFLFFGYIKPYKGVGLLLEAFSKLNNQFSNLTLLIAGKIDAAYELEFNKLYNQITNSKIISNFGFIPDEDLSNYFEAANITTLPYLEASQSGVMFMSYAHGIPVIVPNIGGFPSDIIDGQTGLLFESGNIESLKEAMEQSILQFSDNNQISRFIKNFAFENYSWKATCNELYKIYTNKF